MGERNLRRLIILGASSAAKVAARDPSQASPWLAGMLSRKPRMLDTVALANKLARIGLGADGAWRISQSSGRSSLIAVTV